MYLYEVQVRDQTIFQGKSHRYENPLLYLHPSKFLPIRQEAIIIYISFEYPVPLLQNVFNLLYLRLKHECQILQGNLHEVAFV